MRRALLIIPTLLALLLVGSQRSEAQHLAIKHNLAYDALLTPNLSVEAKLAPRWTADLQLGANFYFYSKDTQSPSYTTRKWSHWMAQPGVRYWTCEAFNGLFVGTHVLGGQANVGKISIPFVLQNKEGIMRDHRYEASFIGVGLSVGYQWALAPRWSLDLEVGAGYARIWYDKFPCATCGSRVSQGVADYIGPTKAAVSLVFFLK